MHIVNLSIRTGVFPDAFKIANIVPIFKSGDKSEVGNYRPISLLPTVSKILEKCVKIQLTNYLEQEKLICEQQYGFQRGVNTSDALYDFTTFVTNKYGIKKCVLIIFLDLAKAFDSVDRSKLLTKLELAGIKNCALKWFKSYFESRLQLVKIKEIESEYADIDFGVIQGSTLGPLLFSIYMNNISKIAIDGKMFLFADDTALVSTGSTWDEAYDRAMQDLIKIKNWLDHNTLSLNIKKTKCLPIYIRNDSGPGQRTLKLHLCGNPRSNDCACNEIEPVEQYKYLGVIVDRKISWVPHVQYVKQRLRKMIYAFTQLAQVLTIEQCRVAYFAYVQSILQYGILVWGGVSANILSPLAITQRAIIKAILKKPRRYPTATLFNEFPVLNVRQIYIKTVLLHIKLTKAKIFHEIEHSYMTRHRVNFGYSMPRIKSNMEMSSTYYLAHTLYKNLPPEILQAETGTVARYKQVLLEWIFLIGPDGAEKLIQSPYV